MTITSILCVFGGSQNELNAVSAAFELGKRFNARILFLHISQDLEPYKDMYGYENGIARQLVRNLEEEGETRFREATNYINSFAPMHHVPIHSPDSPVHHASAHIARKTGKIADIIAREGKAHDLIIIGRDTGVGGGLQHEAILAALFQTARPLLLMPALGGVIPLEWDDKVISLAWDGGAQATRAVTYALPLLERTQKLHIIMARENNRLIDLEQSSGICEYLNCHAVNTDTVAIDSAGNPLGAAILAKAKSLNSSFLIMGAYGHSRMREWLLGGVTKYMLEEADIPLFLSH